MTGTDCPRCHERAQCVGNAMDGCPEYLCPNSHLTHDPVPEVTDYCRTRLLATAVEADAFIQDGRADYREWGRLLGTFVANVQGLASNERWPGKPEDWPS